MLWVPILLLSVSGCLAQVASPDPCPTVETKANFEIPKYTGVWYEAEKFFAEHEVNGKCVQAKYGLNEDGTVSVENSQYSDATGITNSIKGSASVIDRSDNSKIKVVFQIGPNQREAPYWVLDTDYENWAVVWSCKNVDTGSKRYSWILTRARNPPTSVVEQAYSVLDKNHISREGFIKTDQQNCPAA